MKQKDEWRLLAVCLLASIAAGALAAYLVTNFVPKSTGQVYREFYSTETTVGVSPADYVSDLKAGKIDGILVDLRTSAEYQNGHLVTAISIPATEMNESQVLAAFARLPKGEPVIIYCYSEYCMLSKNVGNVLAQNGIYAKDFTAGWYEIQRDFSQYIVNGTSEGSLRPDANYTSGACTTGTGDFRC